MTKTLLCNRCDNAQKIHDQLQKKNKTPLLKQRAKGKHIGCDCKCRMNIEKHNIYSDEQCTKLVASKVVIKDSILSQHKETIEWGYVVCLLHCCLHLLFVCLFTVID